MSPSLMVEPHGAHRLSPGNAGESTRLPPRPRRRSASALAGAATSSWQSPTSQSEHTEGTCPLPRDCQGPSVRDLWFRKRRWIDLACRCVSIDPPRASPLADLETTNGLARKYYFRNRVRVTRGSTPTINWSPLLRCRHAGLWSNPFAFKKLQTHHLRRAPGGHCLLGFDRPTVCMAPKRCSVAGRRNHRPRW
jgi:hypothetical protein